MMSNYSEYTLSREDIQNLAASSLQEWIEGYIEAMPEDATDTDRDEFRAQLDYLAQQKQMEWEETRERLLTTVTTAHGYNEPEEFLGIADDWRGQVYHLPFDQIMTVWYDNDGVVAVSIPVGSTTNTIPKHVREAILNDWHIEFQKWEYWRWTEEEMREQQSETDDD
jgi:hypothetical protein